jgi:flagellar biosynthesis/type III secretory pathway M-ring protein FliF/YscJ
MDLLNQAYTQLYERFRSMTPGARLTAGLLAAVVLLCSGYLFTHQDSSPEADLMHGVALAAGQIQKMESALAEANLNGYEVRGASIYVPRGQEAVYMGALAKAKALPPDFGTALREAASGGSWMELGSQREHERMKIATQDTLAMAIGKMPGIESAYVLYDVDNSPGAFEPKLITATAVVSGQLNEAMVSAVRKMVAGAIAGLKPENVTVSDLTAGKSYGSSETRGVDETSKFQQHVAPLSPPTAGATNAADPPTVTKVQNIDVPVPKSPVPDFQQAALKWLAQSWSTLSLIGLALVSLLILWSMVRSSPATAARPAMADSAASDDDLTEEEQAGAHRALRPKRFDAASPSFREELSAIVEDDPETAANVLRSWIGQGA